MIATPAAFSTGGRDSQGFGTVLANSVVRKNKIFGVMKLTVSPTSYSWDYVADPITRSRTPAAATASELERTRSRTP